MADAGCAVDCAADGAQADFLGQTERYDAMVLDLGLPRVDGLTVLRRWRDAGVAAPVLVLTARASWHEKVQGIDGGADDYMAKPLGNLLDNACKWARSRVVVEAVRREASIVITVDDDGVGLVASMREVVLQRGVRADEAAPGSGLGLAIVRDLAELYGGTIVLEASPLGGLRAVLTLPGS